MIALDNQGNRLPRRRLYQHVKRAFRLFSRLRKDDSGATLIEYTVLLSFLSVAVIFLVIAVGDWVTDKWSSLDSSLQQTIEADDDDDDDDWPAVLSLLLAISAPMEAPEIWSVVPQNRA